MAGMNHRDQPLLIYCSSHLGGGVACKAALVPCGQQLGGEGGGGGGPAVALRIDERHQARHEVPPHQLPRHPPLQDNTSGGF